MELIAFTVASLFVRAPPGSESTVAWAIVLCAVVSAVTLPLWVALLLDARYGPAHAHWYPAPLWYAVVIVTNFHVMVVRRWRP